MMLSRNRMIREKLVLVIMISCVTALAIAGGSFIVSNHISYRNNMVRSLRVQGQMAAQHSAKSVLSGDMDEATATLKTYAAQSFISYVSIYTHEGHFFAGSHDLDDDVVPEAVSETRTYCFENGHLKLFEPIMFDGEHLGVVRIQSDLSELSENLVNNLATMGMVIGGAGLIAFVLSLWLQTLISKPILKLVDLTREVSENNNYTHRAIKTSRDEVGMLIDAYNEMLDVIQNEIDQRRQAQTELERHRDHLEETVQERTAELKSINRQLKMAAEKANLLAKQADDANHAKSEFLANMSHEIRTPMNAIIGFSELLSEEELTGQQHDFVKMVLNSGRGLLHLINDILDFSKIEAGKLETEIIDIEFDPFMAELESLMRPMAAEKALRFEVLRCGRLPKVIRSDSVRVRQCLINLVSNAIKFTEVGHVFVNVECETINDVDYIRFDVEDTGVGIAQDKQAVIFDAFTQADGTTTRKHGGTGLGLSITRQLAGLLGGSLRLKSAPGKGSVFTLIIPAGVKVDQALESDAYDVLDHVTEGAAGQADSAGAPAPSGRILVAEDAAANQALIRALLERLGVEVTLVENGQQALQCLEKEAFDLVFMDMQMPVMNGYEATRRIRRNRWTVPVVALTAHAMKGDEEKCREAGCDDYLSKPISREKLITILEKYLSSSGTIQSFADKTNLHRP